MVIDNRDTDKKIIMRLGTDTNATGFEVQNNSAAAKFAVDASGQTSITGNLDVSSGADITGNLTVADGLLTTTKSTVGVIGLLTQLALLSAVRIGGTNGALEWDEVADQFTVRDGDNIPVVHNLALGDAVTFSDTGVMDLQQVLEISIHQIHFL